MWRKKTPVEEEEEGPGMLPGERIEKCTSSVLAGHSTKRRRRGKKIRPEKGGKSQGHGRFEGRKVYVSFLACWRPIILLPSFNSDAKRGKGGGNILTRGKKNLPANGRGEMGALLRKNV